MPLIKNKTKQVIALTGSAAGTPTGGLAFPIKPDQTRRVPDEIWANSIRKPSVQSMVDSGGLLEIHEPKERPLRKSEPNHEGGYRTEAADATKEKPFSKKHWRECKKVIQAETDAGQLRGLLEDEERPKVKEILQARIEELEAA